MPLVFALYVRADFLASTFNFLFSFKIIILGFWAKNFPASPEQMDF